MAAMCRMHMAYTVPPSRSCTPQVCSVQAIQHELHVISCLTSIKHHSYTSKSHCTLILHNRLDAEETAHWLWKAM